MNYLKIYNNIIEKYKQLNLQKSKDLYIETHHIIPRCKNGSNEITNLVNLTAKAHFVCHHLLTKIYNDKCLYDAFWLMFHYKSDNQQRFYTINASTYDYIKNKRAIFLSKLFKGRKSPMLGRKMTYETKMKISNSNKGKNKGKYIGKKLSEETKKKMSLALKGRKLSEEHKNKLRKPHICLKNRKAPNAKKVLCKELNKVFDHVGKASEFLFGKRIKTKVLRNRCEGKLNRKAFGYTWYYV